MCPTQELILLVIRIVRKVANNKGFRSTRTHRGTYRILVFLCASTCLCVRISVTNARRQAETAHQETSGTVFGEPLTGLTLEQQKEFERGFVLFTKVWTPAEGLGPLINGRSCVECHSEPVPGGSGTAPGSFISLSPWVKDASGGHIFRHFYVSTDDKARPLQQAFPAFRRRSPSLFGLGLLEAVPAIVYRDGTAIGRFGWNANVSNLEDFVATALANELGLTSKRYPRSGNVLPVRPEVKEEQIRFIAQYLRLLAPPPRRRITEAIRKGENIFERIGCTNCHQPVLCTSPDAIPPLRNRIIHAYTDLSLHRMRAPDPALPYFETNIRTPPLWGLASTGPPYLHDGHASSIQEAVLAHDGEGQGAAAAFNGLSGAERAYLLEFLRSL